MEGRSEALIFTLGFLLQYVHQFLHGIGALFQRRLFAFIQLDLIDLLNSLIAQFHWHADKEAMNPVLAFEAHSARQDFLLVL